MGYNRKTDNIQSSWYFVCLRPLVSIAGGLCKKADSYDLPCFTLPSCTGKALLYYCFFFFSFYKMFLNSTDSSYIFVKAIGFTKHYFLGPFSTSFFSSFPSISPFPSFFSSFPSISPLMIGETFFVTSSLGTFDFIVILTPVSYTHLTLPTICSV